MDDTSLDLPIWAVFVIPAALLCAALTVLLLARASHTRQVGTESPSKGQPSLDVQNGLVFAEDCLEHKSKPTAISDRGTTSRQQVPMFSNEQLRHRGSRCQESSSFTNSIGSDGRPTVEKHLPRMDVEVVPCGMLQEQDQSLITGMDATGQSLLDGLSHEAASRDGQDMCFLLTPPLQLGGRGQTLPAAPLAKRGVPPSHANGRQEYTMRSQHMGPAEQGNCHAAPTPKSGIVYASVSNSSIQPHAAPADGAVECDSCASSSSWQSASPSEPAASRRHPYASLSIQTPGNVTDVDDIITVSSVRDTAPASPSASPHSSIAASSLRHKVMLSLPHDSVSSMEPKQAPKREQSTMSDQAGQATCTPPRHTAPQAAGARLTQPQPSPAAAKNVSKVSSQQLPSTEQLPLSPTSSTSSSSTKIPVKSKKSNPIATIGSTLLATIRERSGSFSSDSNKGAKAMVSSKDGEKRAIFRTNKVSPTPTFFAMVHPKPATPTASDGAVSPASSRGKASPTAAALLCAASSKAAGEKSYKDAAVAAAAAAEIVTSPRKQLDKAERERRAAAAEAAYEAWRQRQRQRSGLQPVQAQQQEVDIRDSARRSAVVVPKLTPPLDPQQQQTPKGHHDQQQQAQAQELGRNSPGLKRRALGAALPQLSIGDNGDLGVVQHLGRHERKDSMAALLPNGLLEDDSGSLRSLILTTRDEEQPQSPSQLFTPATSFSYYTPRQTPIALSHASSSPFDNVWSVAPQSPCSAGKALPAFGHSASVGASGRAGAVAAALERAAGEEQQLSGAAPAAAAAGVPSSNSGDLDLRLVNLERLREMLGGASQSGVTVASAGHSLELLPEAGAQCGLLPFQAEAERQQAATAAAAADAWGVPALAMTPTGQQSAMATPRSTMAEQATADQICLPDDLDYDPREQRDSNQRGAGAAAAAAIAGGGSAWPAAGASAGAGLDPALLLLLQQQMPLPELRPIGEHAPLLSPGAAISPGSNYYVQTLSPASPLPLDRVQLPYVQGAAVADAQVLLQAAQLQQGLRSPGAGGATVSPVMLNVDSMPAAAAAAAAAPVMQQLQLHRSPHTPHAQLVGVVSPRVSTTGAGGYVQALHASPTFPGVQPARLPVPVGAAQQQQVTAVVPVLATAPNGMLTVAHATVVLPASAAAAAAAPAAPLQGQLVSVGGNLVLVQPHQAMQLVNVPKSYGPSMTTAVVHVRHQGGAVAAPAPGGESEAVAGAAAAEGAVQPAPSPACDAGKHKV